MVQDEIDPVDIFDPSDNEDTENMVEKPEAAKSQLLFIIKKCSKRYKIQKTESLYMSE